MGKYDDILHLPRHSSETHPHMPMIDRAAQFMPFRALTGYEETVRETARLTEEKPELTEEEKSLLDGKLQRLADKIHRQPRVTLTYFQPDKRKTGGECVTVTGGLKKIHDLDGVLILTGGERIRIEDVLEIQEASECSFKTEENGT